MDTCRTYLTPNIWEKRCARTKECTTRKQADAHALSPATLCHEVVQAKVRASGISFGQTSSRIFRRQWRQGEVGPPTVTRLPPLPTGAQRSTVLAVSSLPPMNLTDPDSSCSQNKNPQQSFVILTSKLLVRKSTTEKEQRCVSLLGCYASAAWFHRSRQTVLKQ